MLNIANTKYVDFILVKNTTYRITMMLLGSAFIALFAQFTVPLLPIPATLQNFAVLL